MVTVSGDGLVHEVLNGFAEHADPLRALSIPVAPIPTGSGNGLSLNILGAEVSISRCEARFIPSLFIRMDLMSRLLL